MLLMGGTLTKCGFKRLHFQNRVFVKTQDEENTKYFEYFSDAGKIRRMSIFRVNIVARNTKNESLSFLPVEAMVDTGSELTWLPRDLLAGIEIKPVRKRSF